MARKTSRGLNLAILSHHSILPIRIGITLSNQVGNRVRVASPIFCYRYSLILVVLQGIHNLEEVLREGYPDRRLVTLLLVSLSSEHGMRASRIARE